MKRKNRIISIGIALTMIFTVAQGSPAAQSPQIPIAGSAIPQFIQPLPLLSVQPGGTMKTVMGNQPITLRMCEFQAAVLPVGTITPGVQPLTWVWGYLVDPTGATPCAQLIPVYANPVTGAVDTYIGPVIVNKRDNFLDTCNIAAVPPLCNLNPAQACATDADCRFETAITYVNELGSAATTNVLAYKYSTDQTLHWADPLGLNCMMQLMGMPPGPNTPCAENYLGPVAAVPHLHGGEVPAELDGGPDAWFTSNGIKGSRYYSAAGAIAGNVAIYKYPNVQEAAPIWFHDHTLGATRLNVYAGLAGGYYIYDPAQNLPANLQPLTEVVPLVLQDRMFDTNGQLFFQADSAGGILWALNPEHPYWSPEFVGDTIVVNGKAWPYLNVQPKRYRFLFLNGSNARTYEMFLANPITKVNGPSVWVIGTDGGYLDAPVMIDPNAAKPAQTKLIIQPGERYEVIIDFTNYAGQTLVLKNVAKTPFPAGAAPTGSLGKMMQFRVSATPVADTSYNPAGGIPLRSGGQQIVRLANPATGTMAVTATKTRQLTLNEVMGMPMNAIDPVTGVLTAFPGGPLELLLNNTKWAGSNRSDMTPVTAGGSTLYLSELPKEGDTEVWEIVNTTADAHPIHLHLVQFQLVNRQDFNVGQYLGAYNAAFPGGAFVPGFGPPLNYNTVQNCSPVNPAVIGGNPCADPFLQGGVHPPLPSEAGWKDTVIMYPGQVTRIAVRYAPTGLPTTAQAGMLYYPFDPSGGDDPATAAIESQFNYVWHCHIIDHEDNEMMRPNIVQLNPLAPAPSLRPLVKGVSY